MQIRLRPLRTRRLFLRELAPADLAALTFLHPRVGGPVQEIDVVQSALLRWLEYMKQLGFSEGGAWAITHAVTGKTIGLCIYGDFNADQTQVILSYGLMPEARKKGYAYEALTSIIPTIFENTEIGLLSADVEPSNSDSIKLLERLHFSTDEDAHVTVAQGRPAKRYGITREAWAAWRE